MDRSLTAGRRLAGGTTEEFTPTTLEGALALATISELRVQSCINMILALCEVVYISVNIVCCVINYYESDDPATWACSPEVSNNIEFWATFCFNIVEVFAVIYSPKEMTRITLSPLLLKLNIFVNIGGSFVAAMLVSVNRAKFQIPAHEIAFTNELTIALFDIILLGSLLRKVSGTRAHLLTSIGSVVLAILVAVCQLSIYNGMGWEGGKSKGENLAHYFEFAFQTASAGVTFWFTVDNKLVADERLKQVFKAVGEGTFGSDSSESSSCNADCEDSTA